MIYIIDEIFIDTKKYKNLSIQPLTETKKYLFLFFKKKDCIILGFAHMLALWLKLRRYVNINKFIYTHAGIDLLYAFCFLFE